MFFQKSGQPLELAVITNQTVLRIFNNESTRAANHQQCQQGAPEGGRNSCSWVYLKIEYTEKIWFLFANPFLLTMELPIDTEVISSISLGIEDISSRGPHVDIHKGWTTNTHD